MISLLINVIALNIVKGVTTHQSIINNRTSIGVLLSTVYALELIQIVDQML